MAPHSQLAATSPLPAELTQPAPIVTVPSTSLSFPWLSCLRVSSTPASSLSLGSQGNRSSFSPYLPSSFLHHPKQGASHLFRPPASHLLSSKPPYQGDSSLIHMCMAAREPASEHAREPFRQSASCVFPMAVAPASKHTHTVQSWLFAAVATAGVSRQQDPAPAQPTPAFSELRGEGCWGAVSGGKSPRRYHAAWHGSAQEGSSRGVCVYCLWERGWGGVLLFYSSLSTLSLLPGSLCYTYLLSPSFICSWLPPFLPPSLSHCFYLCDHPHPHPSHNLSISNSPHTHPNHLFHSPQNKYAKES